MQDHDQRFKNLSRESLGDFVAIRRRLHTDHHQVKGVNRVVYDISSKPPATIEWE